MQRQGLEAGDQVGDVDLSVDLVMLGVDENGGTRAAILDATEQLMLAEGYAAISTRRVGSFPRRKTR